MERDQSDASLAHERDQTDAQIERRSEAAGETADDVIRIARERAREVIELARTRADGLASPSAADEHAQRATIDLIVHDLRSMVQVVSLNAASIVLAADQGAPESTLVELANGVQHASAQMDVLLGDLQELAALEGGRLQLVRREADVAEVVRTVIDINRAAASAHEIELTMQLPADPVIASVDPPRLLRVLMNLVTNALKFTPRGGRVTIALTRTGGGVELAVTDTGPGIPPELREVIFERFRRGPNPGVRGVGLGLYIARAIVQAHDGKLWVDSAPGSGAVFRVQLPG